MTTPKQSKDVDSSLREQILKATHEWIRDCGLDIHDIEPFVDREIMSLITTYIEAAETDARIDELTKMNTRAMDDPDDDTNIFWYRTYTMPEYQARLAALQAQKAVLQSPTERSK